MNDYCAKCTAEILELDGGFKERTPARPTHTIDGLPLCAEHVKEVVDARWHRLKTSAPIPTGPPWRI